MVNLALARLPDSVRHDDGVRDDTLHVEPVIAPDGTTRAYLVWPAEAFEENVVEERREMRELSAAPFWQQP